jgi:hypothetical protein
MAEYKGIVNRLETEGSILSAFDGVTPPQAVFPDPLDSSNSILSGYKGVTPKGYLDNTPR